jgi:NAD(P)-dependent dehydrogenase (short-subunit alcohol dehydrogenase family)
MTAAQQACEGKVALVVGASQGGTGTGTAIRLSAEGAKVAICARSSDKLNDVLARMEDVAGEGCGVVFPCDLADPQGGRDTLIARTEAALGPLDYVVYVAAGGPYAPFESITQEQLQKALEINVKAPWLLAQQAVHSMRTRQLGGAIVHIGTKAARPLSGPPFRDIPPATAGAMYGGTKAALHRFTQSVAAETYDDRIAVNVLAPLAAIGTPALRSGGWIPEEMFEPVETMVEAVLALLTADPSVTTGQDLNSIEYLHALRRPVYDFTGTRLIQGWQPDDLPAYLAARADGAPLSFQGQTNRG